MTKIWRSLLFVAADDAPRVSKVANRGADAVILDLEDAVPFERKEAARSTLPITIERLSEKGCPLVVRINSAWRDIVPDLMAAVRDGVSAIMVPKVESGARLAAVAEMVAEIAADRNLVEPPGLIALIESPAGLAQLDSISRTPGTVGMALGTEDFSLSLGVPSTREVLDLPCRLLALAASRAGIMGLGLPVSIATIKDEAAWRDGIRTARAIGLTGAICIHPRQVAAVNEGFALTAEERATARRIVEAWERADGAGVIQVDGKMVDLPVVRAAERVLARV